MLVGGVRLDHLLHAALFLVAASRGRDVGNFTLDYEDVLSGGLPRIGVHLLLRLIEHVGSDFAAQGGYLLPHFFELYLALVGLGLVLGEDETGLLLAHGKHIKTRLISRGQFLFLS